MSVSSPNSSPDILATREELERLRTAVLAVGELAELGASADRPFPQCVLKAIEAYGWEAVEAIDERNHDLLRVEPGQD